jgi:dihydroflavonol-4-reductase
MVFATRRKGGPLKTLVTGGTGFVGGAIVERLVHRGREVRVLARPTSRVAHLEDLGVEIVRGDILDSESMLNAVADCNVVYHAAAIYDLWVPDPEELRRTEVEGTKCVLESCLRSGVERVIHTSTALAIGEPKGCTGNEKTTHRGYFLGHYERAKFEAERQALSYVEQGLAVICVNPAAVYGAGDFKPSGRSLVDVLSGRIPMLFPGSWSIVHRDDVAEGHILAETEGTPGRRYILSERAVSTAQFFEMACRAGNRKMPRVGPGWVAGVYAGAGEFVARMTGRPPRLPRENYRLLSHGFQVDGSRATRELGLRYHSWEKWLPETIQWYKDQGHI